MQYVTPVLMLPRLNCLAPNRTNESWAGRWGRMWPRRYADGLQRSFGETKGHI